MSLLLALAAFPATASAETVVSCPFDPTSGGDDLDRGFYVSNYPGTNLETVTLRYNNDTAGTYSITLTARSVSFDGPILGTQTVTASLPVSTTASIPVTFNFGAVPVAFGSTITFSQSATNVANLSYNTGFGPCPGVTQTNGTEPPLSTFRRNSVGVGISQVPPSALPVTPPPNTLILPTFGSDTNVSFTGRRLRAERDGDVMLPLRNANVFGVSGNASLRTSRRVQTSALRRVTFGSKSFNVGANATRKVRIRLSRRNLSLLKRLGKVRIRASGTIRDPRGTARTIGKSYTLKEPRR